jgi:Coenzyme PQQ synthesis protein D (PqqD)
VFRQIEGGGVLLNIKSGAYHEINSTAREIWEALETPSTESEVLQRLVERFGDVPELDSDISEFIGMLRNGIWCSPTLTHPIRDSGPSPRDRDARAAARCRLRLTRSRHGREGSGLHQASQSRVRHELRCR